MKLLFRFPWLVSVISLVGSYKILAYLASQGIGWVTILCESLEAVLVAMLLYWFYDHRSSSSKPFKQGDVVQLASGGPTMTLTYFDDCSGWWCIWFDGSRPQNSSFKPELLKRA